MMPDEYKYDYANFSNALYDWIYIEVFKVRGENKKGKESVITGSIFYFLYFYMYLF
jgi:hypothetical protein